MWVPLRVCAAATFSCAHGHARTHCSVHRPAGRLGPSRCAPMLCVRLPLAEACAAQRPLSAVVRLRESSGQPWERVKTRTAHAGPRMAITVLGVLTAPVVALAAMGTLDGFGKTVLNLPRILEHQMRFASRLMQEGNSAGIDLDPLGVFRTKVDESTEYRDNAMRLFVKYDTNGDGSISESEFRTCIETEPLFQTGLPADFASKLLSSMSFERGIGPEEFLTLVKGKSQDPATTAKLLQVLLPLPACAHHGASLPAFQTYCIEYACTHKCISEIVHNARLYLYPCSHCACACVRMCVCLCACMHACIADGGHGGEHGTGRAHRAGGNRL